MTKFLVVSAVFYTDLSEALRDGACGELLADGFEYDHVEVPGALEIPQLMAYGIASGNYVGGVALGTVIRGDTGHYDVVVNESNRALMDLSVRHQWPIGNGILTVETREQAWERASTRHKNKGGDAARAAIHLHTLKEKLLNV